MHFPAGWSATSVSSDLVACLDRIVVPTLFATGDNPLWTMAQAEGQARRIEPGRAEQLASIRHHPAPDDPEGTAALPRAFWIPS